ncbi:MAG: sulfatase-like hydrolase/transferase [Pirellula staleyi]
MFHIILFSQTTTDPSDTVKQAIAFLALLHLPLAALQAADSPASKPNILIILADDMGYADIGAHGCKDIPTPNIDSIAVRGVRFTDAYANGSFCTPTRAALMSCRYQHRFGIASASLRHRRPRRSAPGAARPA